MKKRTTILFTLLLISFQLMFAQVPDWYNKEMNRMVGTWIADNSNYVTEQETDDSYAIQWSWGKNKESLNGILYGLKDGNKTNEYWTFIQFWDDTLQKVRFNQISTFGTKGEGFLESVSIKETKLVQTFTTPEVQTFKEGHKTQIFEGYEVSTSYKIKDDDWIKKRSYKWIKQ